MAIYFTHSLILHLIVFQAVLLVVVVSNILILHRARRHVPPKDWPTVSILVPARNEERNISACIQSLTAQDYPWFEVVVVDDQSNDATPALLAGIAAAQPRLKVLAGSPKPDGRLGKNWACVQLAQAAHGDLLFFTDADTVHQPQTLRSMVTALIGEQADLLTGFPRQQVQTWGEKLFVPFFQWAALCFNPLWLAYRLRLPALSSAVGQMMLFRREAYQAIGGHDKLGTAIVDDLTLARRVKAAGLRWRVVSVTDLIGCRMYHGGREALQGFSKNLFAAFDFRLTAFWFVFAWLVVQFWAPLIVLALLALGLAPAAHLGELAACIGLSLLLWLIPYREMGLPLGLGLLYPLTILANETAAFQSMLFSLRGGLTWKGRALPHPTWRW